MRPKHLSAAAFDDSVKYARLVAGTMASGAKEVIEGYEDGSLSLVSPQSRGSGLLLSMTLEVLYSDLHPFHMHGLRMSYATRWALLGFYRHWASLSEAGRSRLVDWCQLPSEESQKDSDLKARLDLTDRVIWGEPSQLVLKTIEAGALVFGELNNPRNGSEELRRRAQEDLITPVTRAYAEETFETLTELWLQPQHGAGGVFHRPAVPSVDLVDLDYLLEIILTKDKVATPLLADYVKEAPHVTEALETYLPRSVHYLNRHRGLRADVVGPSLDWGL